MAFDPNGHLRSLKGQQYLDVKWRLVWLREEHPTARITTEMTHLDMDRMLAVFRAEIVIPDGGSATGYGSETERDFPAGYIEKAETKAIGRALAALGFGTQFALEFESSGSGDGERIVDSPVTPAKPAARPATHEQALRVVAPATSQDKAGDVDALLKGDVAALLAKDKEAASKLPKPADDMSEEELTKTLAWLRNRARGRS